MKELLSIAISTAKKAGEYLISKKAENKEIINDEGRDIKLEIDQETEKLIRSELSVTKIPVLGEEFGGDLNEKLVWVSKDNLLDVNILPANKIIINELYQFLK